MFGFVFSPLIGANNCNPKNVKAYSKRIFLTAMLSFSR